MEITNNNYSSQASSFQAQEKSDTNAFKQLLEDFFTVHQRAQITGVPTREYDRAVESIGFDKEDSQKAINLLQKHGYNTGTPSIEAIAKYGNTNQAHGNHSYMRNKVEEVDEVKELVNDTQELKKDLSSKNVSSSEIESEAVVEKKPYNYFDAAVKLSTVLSDEEKQQSLAGLLKNENNSEEITSTINSTDNLLKLVEDYIYKKNFTPTTNTSFLSKLLSN